MLHLSQHHLKALVVDSEVALQGTVGGEAQGAAGALVRLLWVVDGHVGTLGCLRWKGHVADVAVERRVS